MLDEVARWTGVGAGAIEQGVDGCGVLCFALPLSAAARGYAALADAAQAGLQPAQAVVESMAAHPELIAGKGRLCTRIGSASGGDVVAKVGAEGVYCAFVRSEGLGIAVKAEDGARRGAEAALVRILDLLGLLTAAARTELADDLRRPIRDTRGDVVGHVEAAFELSSPIGGGSRSTRAGVDA
jgi:L-asparaginase II